MAGIVAVTGLAVTRYASAVWLLARPAAVGRAVSGQEPAPPTWLIRLIGARVLLQGIVELVWPDRRVVAIGQAVDALHATSMVGVAALRPRYRRAALTSATSAALSVVIGAAARSKPPSSRKT